MSLHFIPGFDSATTHPHPADASFDDSADIAVDDDEYLTTVATYVDAFAAAKTVTAEEYGKMARNRGRKAYLGVVRAVKEGEKEREGLAEEPQRSG